MIAPRRSSHSSDRVDEPHAGLVAVAEHARTAARTGRRPQGPAASQRTSGTALRCRLVSFRTPPADRKVCEASCTSPGGPPGAPEPARAQGGRRRRPPASGPSAFNEVTELWKVTELGFPLVAKLSFAVVVVARKKFCCRREIPGALEMRTVIVDFPNLFFLRPALFSLARGYRRGLKVLRNGYISFFLRPALFRLCDLLTCSGI